MTKYIYVFMDDFAMFLLVMVPIIFCIRLGEENIIFLVSGLIAACYEISISMVALIRLILDIKSGLQKKDVRFSVATNKQGLDFFFKVKYIDLFFENADTRKSYRLYSGQMPQGIKTGDTLRISYYPRTRIIDELEKL